MQRLDRKVIDDPTFERQFKGHRGSVNCIEFGHTMRQLATGGDDKFLMMWHFKSDEKVFKYVGHKDKIYSVSFSNNDHLIATGSADKSVKLWVPNNKKESEILCDCNSRAVRSVHFSQDGLHLVVSSDDRTVKIWNVLKKRNVFSLPLHANCVRSAKFSSDDKLVITGCDDKTVKIYSVNSRNCIYCPAEMTSPVSAVAFHPNCNIIAASNQSGTIKLWDIRAKKMLQLYKVHDGSVKSIAFHPSGKYILSGGADKTSKIVNLIEGRLFYTLHGNDSVNGVCFSSSGEYFATTSSDAHVNVWKTNFDTVDYSLCESKSDYENISCIEPVSQNETDNLIKPKFLVKEPDGECKPKPSEQLVGQEAVKSGETFIISKHEYEFLSSRYNDLVSEVAVIKQRLAKLESQRN